MKILQAQKNSVIEILETIVEGHEDSFSPNSKFNNIESRSQLGKSLTERKVKWKILIFDQFTGSMLIPLLKVGDLKGLGVTLRMNIKDQRQPIPDAPCIYLVEPTKENIDIICQDCEANLYESWYLNFVSTISRDMLEYLATRLVQAGVAEKVAKIYEQFLNFVCVEPCFASLEQHSFVSLMKDSKNTSLEPILSGLTSMILCLQVMPIICYKNGTLSETIGKKLESRLRNLTLDRTNLHSLNLDKKRPLLILADRKVDYGVVLAHKWTYRAMVHDIFAMKENSVRVSKEKEGQLPIWETYEIDLNDEFWNTNAGLQFQDFAETLESTMKSHTKRDQEFNERTGLKIGDDTASIDSNQNDTPLSQDVVDQVLGLMDGKKRLNVHVNISMALLEQIKNRKIDRLVSIEESILENKKFDKKVLASFKDMEGMTLEDKLRVLLICHYSKMIHGTAPIGYTKGEFEDVIHGLEKVIKEQRGSDTIPEVDALKSLCENIAVVKPEESHIMNIIGSNLKLFGQTILAPPPNDTLPLTKLTKNLMDQNGDYVYVDPKSGKKIDKFHKFQDAIVFVIGPGNYMEYQNLMDMAIKENKTIQYSCLKIQTGMEFALDLSQIGSRNG